MKEINSLKEIREEKNTCKTAGVIFMFLMFVSGLFYKYELGRTLVLIFGLMFIAFIITMRYWATKEYITKMFNKFKKIDG